MRRNRCGMLTRLWESPPKTPRAQPGCRALLTAPPTTGLVSSSRNGSYSSHQKVTRGNVTFRGYYAKCCLMALRWFFLKNKIVPSLSIFWGGVTFCALVSGVHPSSLLRWQLIPWVDLSPVTLSIGMACEQDDHEHDHEKRKTPLLAMPPADSLCWSPAQQHLFTEQAEQRPQVMIPGSKAGR